MVYHSVRLFHNRAYLHYVASVCCVYYDVYMDIMDGIYKATIHLPYKFYK